jgi:hypothetical protein
MSMRVMYGAPPPPGKGVRVPNTPRAIEEALQKIDDPPPHATDPELDAMLALAKLGPDERKRILRWAVAKWGTS